MENEIWVAIRLDSNGAYSGTEEGMRAKIRQELSARPTHPWHLGRMTSRFSLPPLPAPEETKL